MAKIKKIILYTLTHSPLSTFQKTYNHLIGHNRVINNLKLNLYLKLHTKLYRRITNLAAKVNKGTHPKKNIIKYEQFFLDNIEKNDSVLDVGCHTGYLSNILAYKASRIVGIDIDANRINEAKKKYQVSNLTFIKDDVTTHKFSEKFNKIILSNVLEHIENRLDFLKKIYPMGDKILIRVPLIERDWLSVYKKEKGIEYSLDPTHFIEYTVKNLESELNQSGWKVEKNLIKFGEYFGIIIKK